MGNGPTFLYSFGFRIIGNGPWTGESQLFAEDVYFFCFYQKYKNCYDMIDTCLKIN